MLRSFLMLAAFFAFTGVALGAFAAHGLKNRLSAEYLAIFHTGVTYQLVHALAIFGVALLAAHLPGRLIGWAGGLFAVGILLFSGSLYLLTLSGVGKLGMITPIGGLCFLAGWLCLGLAAWRLG
ncbi:UPF0382 membrane protein [Pseudomonas reidholzensis]|uniref:UPF0382 membrane protein n=1 Tax=Pseudomonas reidholzensis TaxID=1785162 RepID=A0A383S0V4_9PSED|nr:DUF423 domain-containing protein [Pseudomonas reidholzensis]SYX92980.1 UPF0382 membrane protein [Pseudomonas reidholzensis]